MSRALLPSRQSTERRAMSSGRPHCASNIASTMDAPRGSWRHRLSKSVSPAEPPWRRPEPRSGGGAPCPSL
eukprot:963928-Alexandrium_andersonii.AAC.1